MTDILTVTVKAARGLPNMDKRSLTDAYVQVYYGGKKHKTKTVKDNLNPTWDQAPMKSSRLQANAHRCKGFHSAFIIFGSERK